MPVSAPFSDPTVSVSTRNSMLGEESLEGKEKVYVSAFELERSVCENVEIRDCWGVPA